MDKEMVIELANKYTAAWNSQTPANVASFFAEGARSKVSCKVVLLFAWINIGVGRYPRFVIYSRDFSKLEKQNRGTPITPLSNN